MSGLTHACTRAAVVGLLLLLLAAAIAQPAQAKGKPEQPEEAGNGGAGAPEGQGRPDDAGKPDDAGQSQGQEPHAESGSTNASPGPKAAPPYQSSGSPSDPSNPPAASEAPPEAPQEDAAGSASPHSPPANPQSSQSRPSTPVETGNAADQQLRGNPEIPPASSLPPQAAPDARPSSATPQAANLGLQVAHVAAGNLLEWQAPSASEDAEIGAALIEVQRQVGDDWVTVASLPIDVGTFVDADAPTDAVYRLAWTSQVAVPLGPEALEGPLATVAPGLIEDGSMGAWIAGLLWGAIAAIATVRSPGQPSVQDTRVTTDQLLLSALGGLPGMDPVLVQRVQAMGLRTVGQLRSIDPEALAFWTNLPADLFRRWQEAVDMLQWPLLPTGAAQRLAMAGAGSLAQVAAADPKTLYAELHAAPGIATVGPGLPDHPEQVEVWVTEAQKAVRGTGRMAGANGLRGRAPA